MPSFFRIQQGKFSQVALQGLVGAALVFTVLLAVPAHHAHAASILVTTLDDNETVDGKCSLREAIYEANWIVNGYDTADCVGGTDGPDTIEFAVTGGIGLNTPLPRLTSPMTIKGPGVYTSKPSVSISSGNQVQDGFYIAANPGEIVNILHLMITGFTEAGI